MGIAPVKVVSSEVDLRNAVAQAKLQGKHFGFVPTMGALHDGHATLLRQAKAECGYAALSIFVNPTQFGPNEDFAKYPRTLEADLEVAEGAGVDLVFIPSVELMYPAHATSFIDVGAVAEPLCGLFRPGHFRGVATVVCKLFQLVQPTHAYFGQKDLQQCLVIRRMTEDLNIPVNLCFVPTVRESDGMAMSSRNRYLSPNERAEAAVIYKALAAAEKALAAGERSARALESVALAAIAAVPSLKVQYLEVRALPNLVAVDRIEGPVVMAVAAYLGSTRLIDNTNFGFAL